MTSPGHITVDIAATMQAAESLRELGSSARIELAGMLALIDPAAVQAACGNDKVGIPIWQGYQRLVAGLTGSPQALEENLVSFGNLGSLAAELAKRVDDRNADTIRASSLGLNPNGTPVPEGDRRA